MRVGFLLSALLLPLAARAQAPEAPGLYLSRIADCAPCHTRPGGTPFAGGREIGTPFGTLASPNITPDPDTGIGGWTDDQFYAALHGPPVGGGAVPSAMATAAQANFLAADQGAFLSQRVVEMVSSLRQQQPGISDASLTDTSNGAFCPAVANQADLSAAQKRALLARLNVLVQDQVAAGAAPPDTHVVASVPLSPGLAQQLGAAAAAKHLSPAAYMTDLLARGADAK